LAPDGGTRTYGFPASGLATGGTYFYEVAAVNAAGTTAHSTEVSAKTLSPVLQIDAGGGAVGPFIADAGFNTGNAFSSSAAIDVSGVKAPAPQAVYQAVRWAPTFYYSLLNLTPGASYVVRLHFAELSFTGPGQRVFNVALNGTSVLSNFDVFAAAGAQNKAVVKEFSIVGSSNGSLNFAELTWTAPDQRVFNVAINGTHILSGFDILAAAGARDKAVVEQFTAVANTAGQIVISFTQAGADNPAISGIEILH